MTESCSTCGRRRDEFAEMACCKVYSTINKLAREVVARRGHGMFDAGAKAMLRERFGVDYGTGDDT